MRDELRSSDSLVGVWILGQYRIVRMLAQGGMSQVYLAEQVAMERYAAIKVMRPGSSHGREWQTRFRQEARTASRLSHPNIVTVYNFGELADGSLFLAMEYVEGTPLGRILTSRRISAARAADITLQCASALQHAHSMQVVHRDFKPDNVMLTDLAGREQVKVLDFGIARLAEESSQTQPGTLLGTPRYMSPEQCRGEVATALSDQYALGLVFFEMLTGQPAIQATSTIGYLHQHQSFLPPLPSKLCAEKDAERLDSIVMRMLAKQPTGRYPDLTQVIEEIDRVREQFAPDPSEPLCGSIEKTAGVLDAAPSPVSVKGRLDPSRTSIEPILPPVFVCGAEDVLAAEAWSRLDGQSLRLLGRLREAVEPGMAHVGRSCLWVMGLSETGWQEQWGRWAAHGVPVGRVLACINAPLSSANVAAAANIFRAVLVGQLPLDPVLVSFVLRWLHRNRRGGLECLHSAGAIQVIQVTSSAQKSGYVDSFLEDARSEGVRRRVLRLLAELAEEMILNAVFHAPVDPAGHARYAHLPRGSDVILRPGEEAVLRWVIDERYVALSISDSFGTLRPREVFERVTGPERLPNLEAGGGTGMGLRIMSRAAQHLVVAINSSTWCEILAIVPRDLSENTSGRTLTLLKGLGQQARRIGDRLRLFQTQHHGVIRFELKGEINETSDLTVVFQQAGTVHLDLANVTRINSVGIRAWLDGSRARHDQLDLVLERCSPATVSQINMIPALSETGRIASIMVPYFCPACRKDVLEPVQVEEIERQAPPRRSCATCQTELVFDECPEEYFAFLG